MFGLPQLKVRFSRFEMCYTQFDVVQSQIVDKSELCVSERISFEDTYFSLVEAVESFMKLNEDKLTNNQTAQANVSIQLPVINQLNKLPFYL